MQNKATLDNYVILKTLGIGYSGKVKLGQERETGQLRALKILDPSKMNYHKLKKVQKALENELSVMKTLDHPNIVKFVDMKLQGHYRTKKGKEKTVIYAVIELAAKGEIFEVLFKAGPFDENMARFYMKQLVSALDYLHKNKVAHRDLKPENLLLDDHLNLKLADFGFATLFEFGQKNKTNLGTESYMCPELLYKDSYNAYRADVFALGVILFIFYSGHPPFHKAKYEDPYYNLFLANREKFWDFHSKQNNKRGYSESYKELVSGMLEYNPDKRISIEKVKTSTWLNEPINREKALHDMEVYLQSMNKTIYQNDTSVTHNGKNYRHLNDNTNDQDHAANGQQHLLPKDYEKVITEPLEQGKALPNVIYVDCDSKSSLIDGIFKSVHKFSHAKIVWSESKDRFKIKLTTDYNEIISMKVLLFDGGKANFGLGLIRVSGPCVEFYKFKTMLCDLLSKNL